MKTSSIEHPKFEHCLTVHSWQMKATGKHLFASLLLSYLEEKFNLLLELKAMGVPFNKGWIKLNYFQIQNGIYAESKTYVDSAIDLLKGLNFISVNPTSPDFPREENEYWIKFNALEINKWLQIYKKTDEVKMNLLDFNPFLILSVLSGTEEVVKEIVEVEVKTKSPLEKYKGTPKIQIARNLFEFWKWVTEKPRSQPQDKYLKMIIDRLEAGYTEQEITLSFYGMLYRKNTEFAKYDAIHYIVGENAKLDRMSGYAIELGFDEEQTWNEYLVFLEKFQSGTFIEKREVHETKVVNSITGQELK